MRSHVTRVKIAEGAWTVEFQYRKRYEITCDLFAAAFLMVVVPRFNTASGMRSHVT